MKRNHSNAMPGNTGSRAASTAHISHHAAVIEGRGAAEFGGQIEPTVGFQYPDDEDDEPAPQARFIIQLSIG